MSYYSLLFGIETPIQWPGRTSRSLIIQREDEVLHAETELTAIKDELASVKEELAATQAKLVVAQKRSRISDFDVLKNKPYVLKHFIGSEICIKICLVIFLVYAACVYSPCRSLLI